nr:hypothetical protein [Tanacetum cinerariifolium]
MIAYLTKSDASEGFEQILDFLNASVIQYALAVNPTIYVSCIKQFWSSVSLKKKNDVVRLQALIDRRKVIITEDTVRQAIHLDDAESIDCLPNEEIFVELARMGLVRNVDSSSKFYMYPRFLQLMINDQVGDLSSHTTKYTSPTLTQKVFANMRRVEPTLPSSIPATTPPPSQQELISSPPQVAPTPPPSPHQSPIAQPSSPPPQQPPSHDATISMDLLNQLLETCATLTKKVGDLEQDKITQAIEITKLKQRVRKLEKKRKLKAFRRMHPNRGEGIAELDADEDVTLEEVAAEVPKDANLMTEVVTVAAATITAAPSAVRKRKGVVIRDPKETATPSVIGHFESKSKDKRKGILVEEPKPLKKQAQIEQDKAYDRELEAELNANINWNEGRLEESQARVYHLDLEHAQKVLSMQDDEAEPAELKEVVTTAKLMTEVVTAAATTITVAPSAARRRKGVAIRDSKETATPLVIVHSESKSNDKEKRILLEEPKPLKKQAHIEQDEAYARELEAELNATINWNEVIEQVKRKEKLDNTVIRYQALKRKPQTKAQAMRNIMVYLKNMVGFKMDFFKGMPYDDIRPIFEKHFNSIVAFLEKGEEELKEEATNQSKRKSESSKQQAAKKKKLDEEVEELKTHL